MQRRVQTHRSVGLRGMFLIPRLCHPLTDMIPRMPEERRHRVFKTGYISAGGHASGTRVLALRRRRDVPPRDRTQAWHTVSWDGKCSLSKANMRTHTESMTGSPQWGELYWLKEEEPFLRHSSAPPLRYTIKGNYDHYGEVTWEQAMWKSTLSDLYTFVSPAC